MSAQEWSGGGDAPPPQQGTGNAGDMDVTPEALRTLAVSWSLAGDRNLLKLLENIHQTIVLKSEKINDRMERMCAALDNASVSLQNVNNRFNSLSNSQFIESRVYDDDVTASGTSETAATLVPGAPEPAREAAALGATLAEFYDEVRIAADSDSDSDRSDAEDSVVLRARNLYAHRPLPHIIGSRAWTSRPHAGLIEEESDSDDSVDKRKREDVEQYSSSDSLEADTDLPPREARRDEDSYSGETAMSEDSASQAALPAAPDEPPVKPSPADFAAELARRLGGAEPPAAPAPPHPRAPPAPRVPPPRVSHNSLPGHVFSDEPPPLEYSIEDDIIEDQDQDDDDIFADLRNTNVFNKTTNIFNKNTQPNPQSYGGLFDDLLPANDLNRNAAGSSTDIFNDNAHVFTKKDLDKKTGTSDKDNDNLAQTHNVVKKNDALSRSGLFDDDEDDLFADIGVSNIQPISKLGDSKLNNQNIKGLFDDDDDQDGDIFTDKLKPSKRIEEIKVTPSQTKDVLIKDTKKTENKNVSKLSNEVILDTSDPITTGALEKNIGVRKPVGGISLFGTEQGAKSIGAAVLKHARRKHSSSSEDIESEPVEEAMTAKINKNEYINKNIDYKHNNDNTDEDAFTDLFAISKKDKQNITEVVKKNNPNEKFDDLFAQSTMREMAQTIKKNNESSIFADDMFTDDDIFTSTVKSSKDKLPVPKKDIFDGNEDLFSDTEVSVSKPKEKTINIERKGEYTSPSLFHDDEVDDLFATQLDEEKSLKSPKLAQGKDNVNSPKLKKSQVKRTSTDETAKETDHLSFKSSQENKEVKLNENTKSLESDCKPTNITVHQSTMKTQNESIISITKVTPTIDKLDGVPIINDLFTNNEELLLNTKSAEIKETKSIDRLKTIEKKDEYNSPLLFPDDELEDLFATSLVNEKATKISELFQDVHKDTEKDAELGNNDLKSKEIGIKETEHLENKNDNFNENSNFPDSESVQNDISLLNKSTIEAQNKFSHVEKPALKTKPMVINNQSKISSQKTSFETLSENQFSQVKVREKSEIKYKTQDTKGNITDQESSVLSKPERHGDDFFDTIFEDQPPVFQKPTQPKKSKNVNALFDDDSDDDGLFLKKHDNLSLTNSDDAKSIDELLPPTDDKIFDEFHSESPHLDDETFATTIKSDGFMEESPQMIETKSSHGSKEPKSPLENTLKLCSKEIKTDHSFEDLEYVKIVRKEDGQKYEEIISTKFDLPRKPVYNTGPTETDDRAEQIQVKKHSEKNKNYDTQNTKDAIEGKVDSQSNVKAKPIGKLKPINLNINVHGLLPGASPKKINRSETSDLETPEISAEVVTPQIDHVDNTVIAIVKSVSFEKGPESPILVNTFSKERAKIQVKRRPSSRKARKDAIRKSAVDLDFDSDLSETVDVIDNFTTSLPTSPLEATKSLVSNLMVSKEVKDHTRIDTIQHSIERKDTVRQESAGSSSSSGTTKINTLGKVYANRIAEDSETYSELDNSFESKRSGNSDNEDLFSFDPFAISNKHLSVTALENDKEKDVLFKKDPLLIEKNSGTFISQKTDAQFKAAKVKDADVKPKENIFLSEDSDLDELFKSSSNQPQSVAAETKSKVSKTHTKPPADKEVYVPKTPQIKSLEHGKSEHDKTKEEKPLIVEKQSLFEDDIGEDDLFGGVVNTGAMHKLRETKIDNIHGREKVTSDADDEDLFFSKKKDEFSIKSLLSSGKKSLFGDDDSDEDIFRHKSKTTNAPIKPPKAHPVGETSQNTATSAEEVFDDPLSLFK